MKHLFSLFLLLSGCWISARCQTAVLYGSVLDRQSKEPLQGATIEITGKESSGGKNRIHLLSGLDGTFVVRNLHAGGYRISINSVGYGKYEAEVSIRDGRNPLQVDMEKHQTELTTVQVSGHHDRGSERASLMADRRADIVQNSVSARAIEISPDLSVANTAQRISGVSLERSTNGEGQYVIIRGMDKRYIYTLVNGIKIPSPDNKNRYVPLDIFPADMLDRLEMIKSLTPNMEADAIGGAVNMIMKDAPSHFTVNANAALGYASKFFKDDYTHFNAGPSLDKSPRQLYGPAYEATMKDFPNNAFSRDTRHNPIASLGGLSLGGRVLHDKLGILVGASYQNNYRNVNSAFFKLDADANGNTLVTDIQPRQYSIQQQRSGLHAKLDYKLDNKNKISLYGAWLRLMKNEFRFASDTTLNLGRPGPGFGRVTNTYRNRHDVQQIFNTTLKGEHKLGRDLLLDWTGAYSKATFSRPDQGYLNIGTGVNKDGSGNAVQLPQTLYESDRSFAHSSDEDKSGYINLTYKTRIGDVGADWTAGGMYRNKTRVSTFDNYQLRPTNPTNQTYDGDISHNNFEVFNGEGTSNDALNYTAKENVGAGYLMLKLDWNNFLVTGGARLENTDLSWNSNIDERTAGKSGNVTYYDVLPSGNIKYSLTPKQALRLSYYSAISRPNFYEITPHVTQESDAEEDYPEKGNPNLKHTVADNLDLRYEFYPKGLDQLLLGAFYKRLKNPIEFALVNEGTFQYYEAYNFGNATNYGFEFVLSKYWRWFGIQANYTFTNSSITTSKYQPYTIPGKDTGRNVDQKRPLQGQSKHIANLSLLYKDDGRLGLNVQLAFGYTSSRINTVSPYLNGDHWQKGFTQMDLSAEKRLARRWYLYAKVNNILNTPYELEVRQPYTGTGVTGDVKYQTPGKNTFLRKDTYGANYLLGVKFKF